MAVPFPPNRPGGESFATNSDSPFLARQRGLSMARKRAAAGGAAGTSVATIQSEIARKGATWQAGDTPLTTLSSVDQVTRLGLHVTEEERTATKAVIAAAN